MQPGSKRVRTPGNSWEKYKPTLLSNIIVVLLDGCLWH